MRRSLTRVLALPVVSAGILAGVAFGAPAASAATDTGGTVAITLPFSYVEQLAKAGVVTFPCPLSELSVDKSNDTVTVTFTVTGGSGDVRVLRGSLDLSGSLEAVDADGDAVNLGSLQFNLNGGTISAIPAGSSTAIPLLETSGQIILGPGSTNQTYSAPDLLVAPAGAAYLDNALGTSAFTAGQDVGSLSAAWTI